MRLGECPIRALPAFPLSASTYPDDKGFCHQVVPSLLVVASASHREEVFSAARHIIERLKEIVPIWKREHFHDGSAEWVGL